MSLLGTIGNILVCAAVLTNPKLRRGSNFLLCSLAIADLIITMLCEPVFLALLGRKTFFDDCAWSIELAFALLSNLSASISVFHLVAISVDRLVAVVFPLRHKIVMNGYGWKSLLTTSWALPTAIFILVRVLLTVNIAIRLLVNLVVFILCHSVIFLSYTMILIALFKQRKTGNQLRAPSSNATNAHRMETRVAFTLAIVILVFTVCWFPLFVVFATPGRFMVKEFGPAHMWIRTVALSNSAMNFLIYGSRMTNFGKTYVDIFRKILGPPRQWISKILFCRKRRVYSFEK